MCWDVHPAALFLGLPVALGLESEYLQVAGLICIGIIVLLQLYLAFILWISVRGGDPDPADTDDQGQGR